jgi:hypothetical protein
LAHRRLFLPLSEPSGFWGAAVIGQLSRILKRVLRGIDVDPPIEQTLFFGLGRPNQD